MKKLVLICALCCISSDSLMAEPKQIEVQNEIARLKQAELHSGPGFSLVGTVEKGHNTAYAINGEDFSVSDKTEVAGSLQLGVAAQATGKIIDGNKKIADVVVVADPAKRREILSASKGQSDEPITVR